MTPVVTADSAAAESTAPGAIKSDDLDATAVGLTAQAVEQWLVAHPDFFVERPWALEAMVLRDPRAGTNTVSLIERQVVRLRDRQRVMERELEELVEIGKHNDSVDRRLWRLGTRLLANGDLKAMPALLVDTMQHEFSIPSVALVVWSIDSHRTLPDFSRTSRIERTVGPLNADQPPDPTPPRRGRRASSSAARPGGAVVDDSLVRLAGRSEPYCGPFNRDAAHAAQRELASAVRLLPGQGNDVASVAVISLQRQQDAFGLLVLGSPDLERFQVGMGTEFLQLLGSMAGAALGRIFDGPSRG